MSENLDAYLKLDKIGLENKYVILVDGKLVAKEKISKRCSRESDANIPIKDPL